MPLDRLVAEAVVLAGGEHQSAILGSTMSVYQVAMAEMPSAMRANQMSAKDEIESVAKEIRDAFTNEASDSLDERYIRAAKAAMLATLNAIREPTAEQFDELALITDYRLGATEEWRAMIDARKTEIEAV